MAGKKSKKNKPSRVRYRGEGRALINKERRIAKQKRFEEKKRLKKEARKQEKIQEKGVENGV
jgi:hypothetical protein